MKRTTTTTTTTIHMPPSLPVLCLQPCGQWHDLPLEASHAPRDQMTAKVAIETAHQQDEPLVACKLASTRSLMGRLFSRTNNGKRASS
eukprot:2267423-Amphidinium_carterae.1